MDGHTVSHEELLAGASLSGCGRTSTSDGNVATVCKAEERLIVHGPHYPPHPHPVPHSLGIQLETVRHLLDRTAAAHLRVPTLPTVNSMI